MPPVADRAVGEAEELAGLPVDRPQRRQFARLLGILGFVGRNPGWVRAGAVGIVGHGLMSRMPWSFALHASSAVTLALSADTTDSTGRDLARVTGQGAVSLLGTRTYSSTGTLTRAGSGQALGVLTPPASTSKARSEEGRVGKRW